MRFLNTVIPSGSTFVVSGLSSYSEEICMCLSLQIFHPGDQFGPDQAGLARANKIWAIVYDGCIDPAYELGFTAGQVRILRGLRNWLQILETGKEHGTSSSFVAFNATTGRAMLLVASAMQWRF